MRTDKGITSGVVSCRDAAVASVDMREGSLRRAACILVADTAPNLEIQRYVEREHTKARVE